MVFKIVEGVANGLDRGWEAVETFEAIPGVEYVMIFPNAAAAIVDKALDKVTLITSLTGRTITAVEALAINTATHMVSSVLGVTMRTLRMNCFRLSHLHQHIGKTLVEDMDAKGVRICGISNLRPDNNVTISEEDESFQAIKVNFWIKDIRVRIKAMRVTDYSDDPVLKHTPMRVNIRNTKVVGFLEFNKGTLLKLVTIRLRVVKFKNFKIHIPVKEEKRTGVMDVVEGISIVLGQIVKNSINKMLAKWEKKLSRAITGQ
ncbi:hypothetical protein GE061_004811 [Apolygus lucorum]|uniref:Lipid-binding serum glycoprotein N-terminal domain-containing protein n=1 Tax=Apolygus lucorum TaxID=248454 RepID=A0A6A4IYU2_APOLU|nr:hypothetical protein GE061_004811 [Apolygus lucorum]